MLEEHQFPEDSHLAIFRMLSGVTEEELWEAEWAEIPPTGGSAPGDTAPEAPKGGFWKWLFGN